MGLKLVAEMSQGPKNVPARFDSNLPSWGNAYKQNLELSVGGFLSSFGENCTTRSRKANSKREFGLGNFFREGGDGYVWGTDKNIQPHRHRCSTWLDAWGLRHEHAGQGS
jgi:hypothetical protein